MARTFEWHLRHSSFGHSSFFSHFGFVIRHSICGGWNRTNALLVQSQALLPAATTPQCCRQCDARNLQKVRGGGFEPPSPGSKAGSLPLADPRECPAGVGPACPAWKAGAFAARPRARQAAVTGIEPVSGRLTAACSYQHELHRNQVSVVRFELTISCSQGTRIPRLSHTLLYASPPR